MYPLSFNIKINFRKHTKLYAALALLGILINWIPFTPTAQATIPKYVNFQGKLTKVSDGTNVANGDYAFEFKIYDAVTSGNLLWTETYDQTDAGVCNKLTVTNGVFNAKLGTCNALSIDFTGGSLFISVNFAPTGTSYDGAMSPRKQLVAAPFAFVANSLNGDGTIDLADFDTGADGHTIIAPDGAGDALTITVGGAADIQGIVIDAGTTDSTQTAGIIQITADTVTDTAVLGMALTGNIRDAGGNLTVYGNKTTLTVDTDAGSSHTAYGAHITIANNDATSTAYGLYVDAGTGAGTEYAAAFTNGNVGIGDTTPDYLLDVEGTLGVEGAATFVDAVTMTGSGKVFTLAGNGHILWTSRNRLYSLSDGVFGFSNNAGAGAGIVFGNSASSSTGYIKPNGTGIDFRLGDDSAYTGITVLNEILTGNRSASSWLLDGIQLQAAAGTFTDTSTAAAGTAASAAVNSIGQSTLASTNAITTTAAYGLYLAGAPISGANQTLTTTYGLRIAGAATTDGAGGTPTASYSLYVDAQTGATTNYAAVFAGGNVGIGSTTPTQVLDVTGNIRASGDVYVAGDDLFMTTNTDAFILVADGTNFNPVAMSGDITITNAGATAIGNDKVVEADLKAVDAAGDEECLTYETTTGDFEWQACGVPADDSLDFAQFEDTLDLDAALVLNQGTNTWTQNFTGTTGTGHSYAAASLTTGEAIDITATSAPADGSTNEAIDINITHTPTSSADNFQSINLTTTDGTALGNTVYGLQNTITLTGNAAKTGIGDYATVTSSSTTADTLVAFDAASTVTGIMTTGTRSVYGARLQPTAGAESTGGTTNVYGGYSKVTADVGAGGTVLGYGLYVANGTFDTDGTSTQYGLYVEAPTGADTNVAAYFGGNVGIGSTAPGSDLVIAAAGNAAITLDAVDNSNAWLEISHTADGNYGGIRFSEYLVDKYTIGYDGVLGGDSADLNFYTASGAPKLVLDTGGNIGIGDVSPDALFDIDSSATTTNIAGILSTSLTTGETLDITTTHAPADGSTNEAIDINITHTPTSSADNFQSINLTTTDGTALGNTVYGLQNTITLTGNAAKTGIGLYSTVTSSSTTADTLVSLDTATDVTGIITTGTRSVYGARLQPSAGAESTGGTTNVYGGYAKVTADVGAGGTVLGYGLYVANGTFDTDGTSTQIGLYVEAPTGADTNYAAVFAGGNVGIGTTTPVFVIDTGDNSSGARIGPAEIGPWNNSADYVYFGHENVNSTSALDKYAVLQDLNGTTYFNSADHLMFRIDNAEIMRMDGARFSMGIDDSTAVASSNVPTGSLIIGDGILCVDNTGTNCDDSSRTAGTIYAVSTSIGTMDVAENFPSKDTTLTPGEVVAIDANYAEYVKRADAQTPNHMLIGVVSTAPGVTLGNFDNPGYGEDKLYPIALAGRVPVKISNENGTIYPGDYLTASSTKPGFAMKATTAGTVIGQALEGFDGTCVPEPFNPEELILLPGGTNCIDTITVFINLSYHAPSVFELLQNQEINQNLQQSDTFLTDLSNLNMLNAAVFGGLAVRENLYVQKDLHVKGVLIAAEIQSDKVTTKQLCLEDVCINKQQLQQILQSLNGNSSNGGGSSTPPPPEDDGMIAGDSTEEPPTDEIPPPGE